MTVSHKFRILVVAPPGQVVPGELFRQVGGVCVGRFNAWNDFLGIGQELRLDAVLWLDSPADQNVWIEAVTQLSRIRPDTGVVLAPGDQSVVGPMESEIIARRERGQFRSVTAAPRDLPGLINGLRRVLADGGHQVSHLRPEPDLSMLRPAAGTGLSEVIDLRTLRHGSVHGAQHDAASLRPNPTGAGQGRILTVLGPKGGVGKTTVSVGLACLAAEEMPHQVVLVDLDGESADVAVHLDLMDEPDIVDLLPHLEEGSHPLPIYDERLYVVPGPARPDLGALVTPEAVGRILKALSGRFPVVIVDTGARLSDEAAWRAAELANHLVFVLTPDAGSLRMARLLLDHAERFGWQEKHLTAVLNQVYDRPPLEPQRIAGFLGIQINHRIPLDRAAVDGAVLSGRPLAAHRVDHPIAQALRTLGIDLEIVHPAKAVEKTGAGLTQRLRSWLRREGERDGRIDWTSTGGTGRR